jgi:hypothetical protein
MVVQMNRRAPGPSEAELAELAALRERFRGHRIFHEVRGQRGIRYMAYRTAVSVQPHTVITDDLAELRDALEGPSPTLWIVRRPAHGAGNSAAAGQSSQFQLHRHDVHNRPLARGPAHTGHDQGCHPHRWNTARSCEAEAIADHVPVWPALDAQHIGSQAVKHRGHYRQYSALTAAEGGTYRRWSGPRQRHRRWLPRV